MKTRPATRPKVCLTETHCAPSSELLIVTDELSKTKVTGDKNIDAIQDGVNEGVGGQFGKGGLLEGVGNLTSKEVLTRSERQGKDDKGGYI